MFIFGSWGQLQFALIKINHLDKVKNSVTLFRNYLEII